MLSVSVFLRFFKTELKPLRFKCQLELSKITTDVGKIIFHVAESNSCVSQGFGHKTGWQLTLQLYENITVKSTENSNIFLLHLWQKKTF